MFRTQQRENDMKYETPLMDDETEDTPIFTFDSAALAMLVITSLLGLFCIAAVTGFLVGYYK